MFHLIRASLVSAVLVYFIGLVSGATAADPHPPAAAHPSVSSRSAVSAQPPTSAQPAPRTQAPTSLPSPVPQRSKAVSRPGATLPFTATAYCQHGVTRSGVGARSGILAADPSELPVGSVVHVESSVPKYDGIYTVLDTGSKVRGRKVDLFMRNCAEAQHFGRQHARVTVLRKGWSPKATAPKIAQ